MKKIILHIGSTKTGTSAIQSMLVVDRQHLADQQIFVPRGRVDGKAGSGRVTGGNTLILDRFLSRCAADERVAISELAAQFQINDEASPYHTAVISGENLSGFAPESLQQIKRGLLAAHDRIEILFYVRNVVDHAVSQYGEFVKRRKLVQSFSEYAQGYVPHFQAVIEKFDAVFGPEAVQVALYDAVKSDVQSDFLARIGATLPRSVQAPDRVNRSLSLEELDFVRSLNQQKVNTSLIAQAVEKYGFETPKIGKAVLRPRAEDVQAMKGAADGVIDFVNARLSGPARLQLVSPGLVAEQGSAPAVADPADTARMASALLSASMLVASARLDSAKADALIADQKFAEAAEILTRLVAANDLPEHHHALAKCHGALQNKARTLLHARACFAARPDMQANTALLLTMLIEMNRLGEAEAAVAEAGLNGCDRHLVAFYNGRLEYRRKNWAEAKAHFARARALNPANKGYEQWESRAASANDGTEVA